MSLIPWDNVFLTGVINKRKPVPTPIWDRHFSRSKQSPAKTIQWDIVEGPGGIMVNIGWGAASKKAKKGSVKTVSIDLPRFSEHDFIDALDVLPYRAPGTVNGMVAFESKIVEMLDDMRTRIDRTKEFMAIGALTGSVKDGDANVLVEYAVASAVPVNFKTADGIDAFDDAVVTMTQALGSQPGEVVAYCGKTAYKHVRSNAQVQKLLNSAAGTSLITTGNLPNVSGVRIERMLGQYVDNAGDTVPFIGDTDIILVPVGNYFESVYGPCIGKGGQILLNQYYVNKEEIDDPGATKMRVECNPLPVVTYPEAIRRITSSWS